MAEADIALNNNYNKFSTILITCHKPVFTTCNRQSTTWQLIQSATRQLILPPLNIPTSYINLYLKMPKIHIKYRLPMLPCMTTISRHNKHLITVQSNYISVWVHWWQELPQSWAPQLLHMCTLHSITHSMLSPLAPRSP